MRDPKRRRALLEAADRVIRRSGPSASMAEIAAEAGITKVVLYRHFGNKSGLYQALAERHSRVLIAALRVEFTRPGAPLRERARATVVAYLGAIAENLDLYRFLVHRASAEDTLTHSHMGTVLRELGDELAEVILDERLITDRERAHVLAHACVGMVHGTGDWWLEQPAMPLEPVADGLADAITGALKSGRRESRDGEKGPPGG